MKLIHVICKIDQSEMLEYFNMDWLLSPPTKIDLIKILFMMLHYTSRVRYVPMLKIDRYVKVKEVRRNPYLKQMLPSCILCLALMHKTETILDVNNTLGRPTIKCNTLQRSKIIAE
jgi:hypothetical protein